MIVVLKLLLTGGISITKIPQNPKVNHLELKHKKPNDYKLKIIKVKSTIPKVKSPILSSPTIIYQK